MEWKIIFTISGSAAVLITILGVILGETSLAILAAALEAFFAPILAAALVNGLLIILPRGTREKDEL